MIVIELWVLLLIITLSAVVGIAFAFAWYEHRGTVNDRRSYKLGYDAGIAWANTMTKTIDGIMRE